MLLARLMLLVALCGLVAACAGAPSLDKPIDVNTVTLPAAASVAAEAETPLSRAVLNAVNAFRASRNVAPLSNDGTLQRAASVHAADMQLRGFYGHHNPEGQGPHERVLAVSPTFKGKVAENIQIVEGQTYASMSDEALAKALVDKWAISPAHRKNMQSSDITRSGIGIARSGDKFIVVQVFSGS